MLRLFFLLSALALPSSLAWAEDAEVLIEEQARHQWGADLPPDAQIRVRFSSAGVQGAELISAFWMDSDTGRFLANAETAAGMTHRLEGRVSAVMQLPIPNRSLMPGEIVGAADYQMAEMSLSRIGAYTVTDAAKLEGMQVRRMLTQGRPVMTQSVMEPLVIDRGDRVSILYDDGRLVVTAPGRALDSAHRGQELRIVNAVSNKSLVAIAREEGLVEVIR